MVLHDLHDLRMHLLARLQPAAIADDNLFAFVQTRDNFRIARGLNPETLLGRSSISPFAIHHKDGGLITS